MAAFEAAAAAAAAVVSVGGRMALGNNPGSRGEYLKVIHVVISNTIAGTKLYKAFHKRKF